MQGTGENRKAGHGMKKGFAGKLIKAILIAVTLALVTGVMFVCSLHGIQNWFGISEKQSPVLSNRIEVQQTEEERPVLLPELAIQAVFVTDEDGTLCGCFYTLLDCMEGTLEFYTVPLDTRLNLSTELYRELVTKNTKLAQVNTLEGVYRCFDTAEAAECTVKALDEAVGVKTDFYSVMPKSCYDSIMKEDAHAYAYDAFLQENMEEQVKAAGSMKAYLTGLWEQCECSVSVESRLYYLETYEGLTNLRVSCRQAAGEQHNNGYVLEGTGLR